MIPNSSPLGAVLKTYAVHVRRIERLGNAGGLSGAEFWRISTDSGVFCLRRWPPEHPTPERLSTIHSILQHAHRGGFQRLPVPLPTSDGKTFVRMAGSLFELAPWLPGTADFHHRPTRTRLSSAARSLAHFHKSVELFPITGSEPASAPGIRARLDQLQRLRGGELVQLAHTLPTSDAPQLAEVGSRLLRGFASAAPFVEREMLACEPVRVAIQPCIRDIRHDHVLYVGDEVSGFVDFGAVRVDNVTCDIARMMGSLVGDNPDEREFTLREYQSVRSLTPEERRLVEAFDSSTVLLSGMNWLRWLNVEKRSFPEPERIRLRLLEIADRLDHLVAKITP